MSASLDPLFGPPPEEVPLANAPLVRVIAQIRFPSVLSIAQRDFVAPFQESLRRAYPVLREEQTQVLVLSPTGFAPAPQVVWRFRDLEGHWRVSLAPEFLALEATKYTSRADFFERLGAAVEALDEHVGPELIDRLGIRYINRVTGAAVDEIASLVRPEVCGIVGSSEAPRIAHAISETLFDLPGEQVLARWGRLPSGATVDPAAIEPIEEKSWILDLDMFTKDSGSFAADRVVADAKRFADQIYTIFRWAVTPAFLRRYGGKS